MKHLLLLIAICCAPLAAARPPRAQAPRDRAQEMMAWARMAALADKQTLLQVKADQDRPNYPGNAYAKIHDNLWKSIIEGKAKIPAKKP